MQRPNPPPDTRYDPQARAAWRARADVKAANTYADWHRYMFDETTDGLLKAEDVPPGKYSVSITVLGPSGSSNWGLRAQAEVPLTVPADPLSGTLDLGEIQLQPVGSSR